ncbi:MAG: TonB-dependent receptor [Bacteroidetes bacterium]|nr:TonB-dependent receptor [Bacteroidota bacterium]
MKLNNIRVLFLLFLSFGGQLLYAQISTIKGTVTSDEDGSTIPGVNVVIKGTTHGVTTDIDGKYAIQASPSDFLVFSFVGYQQVEKKVGNLAFFNLSLKPEVKALDEVVVVGYGSKKKSDLIGSVNSVRTDKMVAKASTDLQGMLKGVVAGLLVTTGSSRPGGSSSLLLRGTNSLLGGTGPLYVVDGIPVNSIDDINANDIETISVLKDASAQGIYGARASNGVILITTHRGSDTKGKINISYNTLISIQNVKPNFEVYSPEEYMQVRREAYRANYATAANGYTGDYKPDSLIFTPFELESIKNKNYVNWMDLAFKKNVPLVKHDISISGGNEKTKYAASLGYYNQDGVRYSSDYKRYTGKLALDQKVNKWLNTGISAYYANSLQHQETNSWVDFITFSPIAKLYDDNGDLIQYPLGDMKSINPLIWENTRSYAVTSNRGMYIGYLEISPIKGLKFKTTASMDLTSKEYDTFLSKQDPSSVLGKGYASALFLDQRSYLLENMLTYEAKLNNGHRFDVTLLQSADKRQTTSTTTSATSLGNDFFGINSLGSALESTTARDKEKHYILSFMGRINYVINEKYLLNFTLRSDGSSVFGANNKWSYFPSGAIAWNMHKENFLKSVKWINESKLRLSYGQIGNEAISPYGSLSTAVNMFYVSNGTPIAGYLPSTTLPNPNLRWETSTTYNIGYDFSLFNQKLNGSIDVYKRITTDLLTKRTIPASLGYTNMYFNLGEIQNKGVEITLNSYIVSNDKFTWQVGANFTLNRNKLTKGVLQDSAGRYIDDVANKWFIGKSVNVYYDYQSDGIWQTSDILDSLNKYSMPKARPGDVRIRDVSGPNGVPDSTITVDDKVIINKDPKWIASFSTSLAYQGFELSADVYILRGVTKSNPFMSDFNDGGTLQGTLNGIKRDYWTPENASTSCFRPNETSVSPYIASLNYQDASYIRLSNITLAYSLPQNWISSLKISRFKMYVRADNLFTITKFMSMSTETNPDSYPETVNYIFGINMNF